jgi:hypothetical protein
MHICVLDKECRYNWRNFGAPLRIYWGKSVHSDKFWTIPFLDGGRRSQEFVDSYYNGLPHVYVLVGRSWKTAALKEAIWMDGVLVNRVILPNN